MTRRPVSLAYAAEARRRRIVRAAWYGGQAIMVAALIGTGCAALAQEWSADCSAVEAVPGAVTRRVGTDMLVLAPHPQAEAQLCYHNHARQGSLAGRYTLRLGDFAVTVRLSVGPGPETATILPPPGYMVWPADAAQMRVDDGEAATVQIFGGLM